MSAPQENQENAVVAAGGEDAAAVAKVGTTVVRRSDIERANNAFAKGIELLYDLKMLPRALSLMTEAICVKPRNAAWFMARGQVNRAMGRYHHALHDFSSVIKLEPRNGACYCLRSIALRKLRKYGPALADANTALQLEPENASYRFYRGLILMEAEEYSSACDDFTAAAEGSDKLAFRCRLLRAACQEKLGLFQEALVDLAAAVRLEPQNSASYDSLAAFLMRQGHYHEALHQLNQANAYLATSTYPPSLVLARRSEANFALQKYGAALADAQLAVACLPQAHGDLVGQTGIMKPLVADIPCDPELLLPNHHHHHSGSSAASRPGSSSAASAGAAAAGGAAPATPAAGAAGAAAPVPAAAPPGSASTAGGIDLSELLSQPSTAYSLSLCDILFTKDAPYVYLRRGLAYLANQLPLAALPDLLHASLCADALVRRFETNAQGGKDKRGNNGGEGGEEGGGKGEGNAGRDSPGRKKAGFGGSRRTGSALGRGGAGASSLFGGPAIDSVEVLAPELAQTLGEPLPPSIYSGLAAVASSLTAMGGSNTGIPPPSATAVGLGFLTASAAGGAAGTAGGAPGTAGLTSPGTAGVAGGRTSRGTRGTLATANSGRAALLSAGSNNTGGGAGWATGPAADAALLSDDENSTALFGAGGFSAGAGQAVVVDEDVIANLLTPKPPRHTPFGPAITHPGAAPELPEPLLHDDEEPLSDVENEIRSTFSVPADRVGRGRRRSLVVQQKDKDQLAVAAAGGGGPGGADDDDDDDGPGGADEKKDDEGPRSPGLYRRGGAGAGGGGVDKGAEGTKASLAAYELSLTPQETEMRKKAATIARRSVRSRIFRSQQNVAALSGGGGTAGNAGGGGGNTSRGDLASRGAQTPGGSSSAIVPAGGGAGGGIGAGGGASAAATILAHLSVNAMISTSSSGYQGPLPPQVRPAITRQAKLAAAVSAPRLRCRAPLVALGQAWPAEPAPWIMPQKSRDLAMLVSQIQLGLGLAYGSLRHYVRARVHAQRSIIAFPANVAAIVAEAHVERALKLSGPADIRLTSLLQLTTNESCGDIASALIKPSLRLHPFTELVSGGGLYLPPSGVSAFIVNAATDLLMTYSKRFAASPSTPSSARSIAMLRRAAAVAAGRAAAEKEARSDGPPQPKRTRGTPGGGLAVALMADGTLAPAFDDLAEGLSEQSGLSMEPEASLSSSAAGQQQQSAGAIVAANAAAVATAAVLGGGSGNPVLEMRAGVGMTSYKTLMRRYLRSVLGKVRKLPAKAKMTDATVRDGPLPGSYEAKEPDLPDEDEEAKKSVDPNAANREKGMGGPVVPVPVAPRGSSSSAGAENTSSGKSGSSSSSSSFGAGDEDEDDGDDIATDEDDDGNEILAHRFSSMSIGARGARAGSYLEPLDGDESGTDGEFTGAGVGSSTNPYGSATDLASFGLQPVEGGIFGGSSSGPSVAGSPTHHTASFSFSSDGAGSPTSTAMTVARGRVGSNVGEGGHQSRGHAIAAATNPHHPAASALRDAMERDEFSQRRASSHLWTQEAGDGAVSILMQGLTSLIANFPAATTHIDCVIRRPALAQLMPTSAMAADSDAEVIDIEAQAENQAVAMRRISAEDDEDDASDNETDENKAAEGGGGAAATDSKAGDAKGDGASKPKKEKKSSKKLAQSLSWMTNTLTGVTSGKNAVGSRGPGYPAASNRGQSGGTAGLLKKLMLKGGGNARTANITIEAVEKDGENKSDDEDEDEQEDKAGQPPPTAGSSSSSSSSSSVPRSSRGLGKDGKGGRSAKDGLFRGMTTLDYGQAFWEPAAYLLETNKVRAFVLTLRGINRQSLHAHHEAVKDFELAIKHEPSRGDTHLHKAVSLLALGQPDAAANSCLEALKMGSDVAVGNDRLGQARRQQGQHDKAVEAFTAALDAHPGYPPYLSRRAAALRTLGKLDESLADLNQALATMGGLEPRLLRQRGEVYARQNRFEAAIQDYLSALQALALQAGGVSTGGLSGPAGATKTSSGSSTAIVPSRGGGGAVASFAPAAPGGGAGNITALAFFRHAADVHFHAGICAANLDKHERALQHFNAGLAALNHVQESRRLLELASRYQQRLRGPNALVLLNAPAPPISKFVQSQSPKGTSNPFKRPTAITNGGPAGSSAAAGGGSRGAGTAGNSRAGGAAAPAPAPAPGGRRNSMSGPEAAVAAAAAAAAHGNALSDDQMKSLYQNATMLPNSSAAGVAQAITGAVFSQSSLARKKQLAREAEAAAAANGSKDPRSLRYGMGLGAGGNAGSSPLHSNVAFVAERRTLLRILARNAENLNRRAPDAFLPLLRAALHHERAKALQMLGRHQEAFLDFTLVLAHAPTNANATFRRAFSARAMRFFVAAGDDFETAAALAPDDERFQINYNGLTDVATVVLVAAGEEPHCDIAGALDAVNTVARSRVGGALSAHGVGFEPIDGIADDGIN